MERGVTVITGAASGMGLACARRLLRPDEILLLADIDEGKLRSVRDDVAEYAASDDDVRTAVVDVTDAAAVNALADEVRALGSLRTLAHAAGISPTMANWQAVLLVDLVGTALMLEAMRPLARPGTVAVCWASNAAHITAVVHGDETLDAIIDDPLAPDFLARFEAAVNEDFASSEAYSWAKRGVIRLVRRHAAAWGERGARVCSISPGIINTPMSRQEFAAQPLMKVMIDNTPIPRFGAPSEIAELVAFLASPNAGYITGCDILIDGGVSAALGQIQ